MIEIQKTSSIDYMALGSHTRNMHTDGYLVLVNSKVKQQEGSGARKNKRRRRIQHIPTTTRT